MLLAFINKLLPKILASENKSSLRFIQVESYLEWLRKNEDRRVDFPELHKFLSSVSNKEIHYFMMSFLYDHQYTAKGFDIDAFRTMRQLKRGKNAIKNK